MKCQSISCLWSTCPPSHKVTAFTTLADPSTLYTGGSDGSIVWWNLVTPYDPYPMALLCGHAAEIADLTVCAPMVHSEIPTPSESLALFSACGDGVLCVWSRGSGHCRKRRKLPPWAGTPRASVQVRGNPRFVCIACVSEAEGVDGEIERKRGLNAKVAVLVVDSCSLNIVRTLFDGIWELGDLRCVSMVPGLGKDDSFALVDAAGRVQLVGVEGKGDVRSDGQGSSPLSSSVVGFIPNESLNDGTDVVSFDVCGKILVLVYDTMCVFKCVITGSVIGEILLAQTPIRDEGQLSGCIFLHDDLHECGFNRQELEEGVEERFVLWNKKGSAVIYVTRVLRKKLCFQLHFESLTMIKGISHKIDEQNSLYFCKLDGYIVCVESFCSRVGGSSLWRPHVTIWSFPELPLHHSISHGGSGKELKESASSNTNDLSMSALLGRGDFSVSWRENISYNYVNQIGKETYSNESKIGCKEVNKQEHISDCNEQAVSSSMVLSEDAYAPYAVVYGFYSGDIEIIRFCDSSDEINSAGRRVSYHTDRHITKQSFTGHTGAIICLAVHHLLSPPKENGLHKLLISGSTDCTIRLWDLDNCILLYVLHHHVSPVKQIILPPPQTDTPWCNCFISVGEDCCVALVSLDTMKVERMFPGHPCYPSRVVWDSRRGYLACLCRDLSSLSVTFTALYLWDVKTGALERVFHGAFSYSVFDYFCRGIDINANTGNILGGNTSASLLHLPVIEDASLSSSHIPVYQKESATTVRESTDVVDSSSNLMRGGKVIPHSERNISYDTAGNSSLMQSLTDSGTHRIKHPIKCSCPFPGIAALKFGLKSLLSSYQTNKHDAPICDQQVNIVKFDQETNNLDVQRKPFKGASSGERAVNFQIKESIEEYLIRFSLGFLHLWDVNLELDKLLMEEMNIRRPEGLFVASGVPGDRGSMALMFPGLRPSLELWKFSAEFCAMRSLTIVSLAQCLVTLSHSSSAASSVLAAFYTRNFAERVPDVKPPLLQLLVSFWQDPSEHVRMAARSLFHCAAPRAIPRPIFCKRTSQPASTSIPMLLTEEYPLCNSGHGSGDNNVDSDYNNQHVETDIAAWLESYEMHDWISCIGGTIQDAMASHIIVASALAVWYPSIVNAKLVTLVVNHLVKLVMSINDRYSSTAAELLAEGMDTTWKTCIALEIPRLIADIFFQIECLSSVSSTKTNQNSALNINIRDALVGILLPSLAMADIPGFLNAIESQIWATSSDSPVHLVSVTTLIRVIRGSPKPLAPYLDKVINFVLQTLDHANSAMRKICLQSSMVALKEVARVFPMVALSEANTRLAVADAVGDISNITIRVYDLQSMAKIKVLDASGPPGLPTLLTGSSRSKVISAISAVSFSPDGEGLVAFSEHGLVIRWWSLGIAWWEKLSKSLVPVQCTKLIFVPPWEGISPNSSRTSMIANIGGPDNGARSPDKKGEPNDADSLRFLINKIDLSYRLDWTDGRKVVLSRYKHELGTFQF